MAEARVMKYAVGTKLVNHCGLKFEVIEYCTKWITTYGLKSLATGEVTYFVCEFIEDEKCWWLDLRQPCPQNLTNQELINQYCGHPGPVIELDTPLPPVV